MLQNKTVRKYDTYKDSGIEWIGEIPQNWDVKRLKVLAKLQTGNTPPKENDVSVYYTDEGFLWVKPDNLSGFSPIKNTNEYLNEDGYKIARVAPEGTPLVCCIGSIGKYGVAEQDVAFNQQINAVIFNKMMDNKFGLYHISCQEEQHWYYANGNVVQILNTQNQGKLLFACPPKDEQQRIAEYLDKKCGEIDKVVEAEKSLIEKLKEYKQSVITEAVTKGLDKSVPLKDSGIEWIGKIPQHWEVGKIKHKFHLSSDINDDENATLLSLFTHIGVKPRAEMEDKGNKAQTVLGYSLVKKDDIIVNKLLAWMGAIGLSSYNGATSPDYDIYRSRNIQDDCPMFYHYLFRSCNFKDECYKYGRGIMLMRLRTYPEEFLNIYIPIISKDEQENIVNYLNQKCSEIDKAIADKEKVIEKFTEYKKSLIYECVTGKRKVVT